MNIVDRTTTDLASMENLNWQYLSTCPIHSVFGAREGFSGSADTKPLPLPPCWKILNGYRDQPQQRTSDPFHVWFEDWVLGSADNTSFQRKKCASVILE